MTELLAPAGNMEALKAAIANGCDAVYLGMQKFGARAYSCNFDETTLREAASYAHLREVKVFVTMNTIVFEEELSDMRAQLAFLNEIGVDGVIVQDMAVFDYIVNHFPDMEAHCSTQMGIDDLDGTLFWKELGAERVVLAREVDIEKAKKIRREAKVPIEIFVHGALCVSYSGNCLMSGLIGYRSGNRGRCVGSCRKPYELLNKTTGKSLGTSYLLSTKDLNTIDYIKDLKELKSYRKTSDSMRGIPQYASVAEGYFNVPEDGVYVLSSEYENVWVDGKLVIDNGGEVKRFSRRDRGVALQKGLHQLKVVFLGHIVGGWPSNWSDGVVRYRNVNADEFTPISADMLVH